MALTCFGPRASDVRGARAGNGFCTPTGRTRLTSAGAFLGTPLYASPEQIKRESLGERSDVYSVTATLFFLLTGRAPFQGNDGVATMARILTNPLPSVRALRPEVSAKLEAVIQRGLEREPRRRWQNLSELRAALRPYIPDQLTAGTVGLRFVAFLFDYLILTILVAVPLSIGLPEANPTLKTVILELAYGVLFVGYFTGCEYRWGAAIGKRLLGLRVYPVGGYGAPGFARAFVRSLAMYGILWLMDWSTWSEINGRLALSLFVVASAGLVAPMRRRNGYRGLVDMLSRTRVVRLSPPSRRPSHAQSLVSALGDDLTHPEGLPEQVEGFTVRGQLVATRSGAVLIGRERGLGREVVLWCRSAEAAALSPGRHQIQRATRLRWLAGGRDGDSQWDAFLAPVGLPLADFVQANVRLTWTDTRPILEQLADEQIAGIDDGSLPDCLCVEQVWIRPDGTVQLLDTALTLVTTRERPDESQPDPPAQRRSLGLLRQVAVLALEGGPLQEKAPPRAPVPIHAARMLQRLFGIPLKQRRWIGRVISGRLFGSQAELGHHAHATLEEFRADLAASAARPTEFTRRHRAAHLALASVVFGLGFIVSLLGGLPLAFEVHAISGWINVAQRDLTTLRAVDYVSCAITPEPLTRLGAVAQLAADHDQQAYLENSLAFYTWDRQGRSQSLSRWTRMALDWLDHQGTPEPAPDPERDLRYDVPSETSD
jgi:uncharacterized RDD family membrane protein YckC